MLLALFGCLLLAGLLGFLTYRTYRDGDRARWQYGTLRRFAGWMFGILCFTAAGVLAFSTGWADHASALGMIGLTIGLGLGRVLQLLLWLILWERGDPGSSPGEQAADPDD